MCYFFKIKNRYQLQYWGRALEIFPVQFPMVKYLSTWGFKSKVLPLTDRSAWV